MFRELSRRRTQRATAACAALLVVTFAIRGLSDEIPPVRVAPDRLGFVAGEESWAPVGVNYFDPDTGWAPKLWQEFREDRVEGHFRQMESLGINVVRVFTTAASFIPEPPRLDEEALHKLDRLLEIAARHGVRVHPTGPDHWEGNPPWRREDIFTDPQALEAQVAFWRNLAARYRGDARIFAFDLLNEPHVRWKNTRMVDGFRRSLREKYGTSEELRKAWSGGDDLDIAGVQPPDDEPAPGSSALLDYQRYRESVAERWVRLQADAIRKEDPGRLITVGLIQWSVPVLVGRPSRYAAFRPDRVATMLDFSSVHFYPLRGDPLGGADAFDANLAYLEFVARICRTNQPLVIGEFGWYGGGQPDHHAARSVEDQLRWNRALIDQTRGLACGWLNWAWADTPSSRDITKYSGLVTFEGDVKPWGDAFRKVSKDLRAARLLDTSGSTDTAFRFDFDRAICDPPRGDEELGRYTESWKEKRRLPIVVE